MRAECGTEVSISVMCPWCYAGSGSQGTLRERSDVDPSNFTRSSRAGRPRTTPAAEFRRGGGADDFGDAFAKDALYYGMGSTRS